MRPVDLLLAGYLAFTTVVLALRGGIGRDAWWLLAAHLLFGLLLFLFTRLQPGQRVGTVVHDLYPLFLLSALYAELGVMAGGLEPHRVLANDAVVQRWEAALFGGQVAYEWIRRAPSTFWSTVLHLAYFAYYPIVVLGPIALMLRHQRAGARQVLFATMMAFVACYVVFLLYPVAGPYYAFEHPQGTVREVWSARLVYGILQSGSSFGAAFPSSHVAATVAAVGVLWSVWRPLAAGFVIPAALLVVGTVYCQMHYGVDVIAGLAVGAGAVLLGRSVPA